MDTFTDACADMRARTCLDVSIETCAGMGHVYGIVCEQVYESRVYRHVYRLSALHSHIAHLVVI